MRRCASPQPPVPPDNACRLCPPGNLHTGGSDGRGSVSIHQITPISQTLMLEAFISVSFLAACFDSSVPCSRLRKTPALERRKSGAWAHVVSLFSLSATFISPRIIRFMLGCSFTCLRVKRANFLGSFQMLQHQQSA